MSAQNSPALAGQIEHQGNHHTAALKPCPFCGNAKTPELVSAAELYCESQEELDSWPHSDSYAVICNATKPRGPGGCGATGGFCPSERLAMQVWNKRVPRYPTPLAVVAGDADWRAPTTFLQRFGDAVERLCGKRPGDDLMAMWLDRDADDIQLQEFAIAHGPAWAQGIAVIDAALVLANQPTEDANHEFRTHHILGQP